jgi:hypothetical protein
MSGEDLEAEIPGITVLTYKQLNRLNALPRLPCAILYETSPGYGHWTGLLQTPQGVEHFDSYGLKPDGELKFVPDSLKVVLGEAYPRLTELLLRDGRPINYSAAVLQDNNPLIATCGRHVCARMLFMKTSAEKYARIIRGTSKALSVTPDGLVSMLITR